MSEIIVKKADTPDEIRELQHLRYRIYCENLHWLDHRNYVKKLEIDEYDSFSLHFGAFKNKKAIGAIRLILENPKGFPIKKICPKNPEDKFKNKKIKLSEISRLIVDKNNDNIKYQNKITLALIKQIYYISKYSKGITHWFAAFDIFVHRLIRMLGFKFEPLDAPKFFMGSKTVPTILSKDELDEYLKKYKPKLYDYLNAPHKIFYNPMD